MTKRRTCNFHQSSKPKLYRAVIREYIDGVANWVKIGWYCKVCKRIQQGDY